MRATRTERPGGPAWRRRAIALTTVGVVALTGCAAEDEDDADEPSLSEQLEEDTEADDGDASTEQDEATLEEGDEAMLEHTLVFEHLGMLGYERADLAPDGAITVEYGASDPFTARLDDDDLARVRDALEAAQLDEQPTEIQGDEVVDDETVYRFEYGDARVEAEFTHAPTEVRELGSLLAELVDELAQEHRSEG